MNPAKTYTPDTFATTLANHDPHKAQQVRELLNDTTRDPNDTATRLGTLLDRGVTLEQNPTRLAWANANGDRIEIKTDAMAPTTEPTEAATHDDAATGETPDDASREPTGEPAEEPATSSQATPATFFRDLARLTNDATLLLTIARTGGSDDDPELHVGVIPKPTNKDADATTQPFAVTATATELDADFTTLIGTVVTGNQGIRDAIAELEAAKKAEADAKKAEANAKKKNAKTAQTKATKATEKATGAPSLFGDTTDDSNNEQPTDKPG